MFVDFEIKSYGKHRHYTHRREGQMNTNQSNMEYDLRVMKRNLRVTQRREGKTVTFNFLDGDVAGLMQDAQAIPIPWQFELTPLDGVATVTEKGKVTQFGVGKDVIPWMTFQLC